MAERLESHRRARPASALLLTVLLSFLVQGCSSDEAGAKPAADTTQDGSGDTASADTSTDSSTTDSTTADSSDGSAADTVEQDGSGSGDTSPEDPGTCLLGSGDTDPDSAPGIGCFADYEAVSAAPLKASRARDRPRPLSTASTATTSTSRTAAATPSTGSSPRPTSPATACRSFRSLASSTRPSITPPIAGSSSAPSTITKGPASGPTRLRPTTRRAPR